VSQQRKFWTIIYEQDYIDQVITNPIDVQNNIGNVITGLTYHDDPRTVAGAWDDCGNDDKDCPFIVAIFVGLPFEFMFEMDYDARKLTFIDCIPLPIFHPQE
jgi:hypothetical protein